MRRIATNSSVIRHILYHHSYCNPSTTSRSTAWFTTRANLSSRFRTATIQGTIWATTVQSLSILPLSPGLITAKLRRNVIAKLTVSGWTSLILSVNFAENQLPSIMKRQMMTRKTKTKTTSQPIFRLRLAVSRVSLSQRVRRERGTLATKTGSKRSRSFGYDSRHLPLNPAFYVRMTISSKSYFRQTMDSKPIACVACILQKHGSQMTMDRTRFVESIALTRQDWSSSAICAAVRKELYSNAHSLNVRERITLHVLQLRQCRLTLEKSQYMVMTVPSTRTRQSTSDARCIVARDSRTWTRTHSRRMSGFAHALLS